MKTGVLLLNVGTPESPEPESVRSYLAEFLMDPSIIELPFLFRWFLVYMIILRNRPESSSEAYKKIWTERGSPLRWLTEEFKEKLEIVLARSFQTDFMVEVAMRYGNPSLLKALEKMKAKGVNQLVAFPLFPQASEATTGSSLKALARALRKMKWNIPVREIEPFYKDEGYLNAWQSRATAYLRAFNPDHVLMSFHGLPERQIKKNAADKNHCLRAEACCDIICEVNQKCYRAQCYDNARLLAARLQISEYTVAFQSRLGRAQWIRPYTDVVIERLARGGKKRIAVLCPAFVTDCLETLEEIGIRAKQQFLGWGGEDFLVIPCLNSEASWVESAASLIRRSIE